MGLRCPSHPVAHALLVQCAALGVTGLAAPSANRFGRISPTAAAHVVQEFGDTLAVLDGAGVPAGRIYTVADIAADPHYAARGMLQQVQMDDGTRLTVPGIVPKLSATPGSHRRNAPTLGQDTGEVLRELGLTDTQITALRERGIVN